MKKLLLIFLLCYVAAGCGAKDAAGGRAWGEWIADAENPQAHDRLQAIATLGTYEGSDQAKVVEVFIGALKDPDWQVRRAAAEALGQLGPRAAAARGALLAALHDEVFYVVVDARYALIAQGSEVIPDFLKLARGPEGAVRDESIGALATLAPQAGVAAGEIVDALLSLARSQRLDERWMVLNALQQYAEHCPEAAQKCAAVAADELRSTTEIARLRLCALGILHTLAAAKKLNGEAEAVLAAAAHDRDPALAKTAQALAAGRK